MYSGSHSIPDSVSRLDLRATFESAQSFLWQRVDGGMYEETTASDGDHWYYTVVEDNLVFARQQSGRLDWRATTDAASILRRRLSSTTISTKSLLASPRNPLSKRQTASTPGSE